MAAVRQVVKTVMSKEQMEGVGARVRRSIGTREVGIALTASPPEEMGCCIEL